VSSSSTVHIYKYLASPSTKIWLPPSGTCTVPWRLQTAVNLTFHCCQLFPYFFIKKLANFLQCAYVSIWDSQLPLNILVIWLFCVSVWHHRTVVLLTQNNSQIEKLALRHTNNSTTVRVPVAFTVSTTAISRRQSQQPRGLRRRSAAIHLLRLWVRIPPGSWMFFCCECCVLSGRGLCEELITRPEEFYRLRCVVVCDLETSWGEKALAPWGAIAPWKTKNFTSLQQLSLPHLQ